MGSWALCLSPESWHILMYMYWPVAKKIALIYISIFSSGGHVVHNDVVLI